MLKTIYIIYLAAINLCAFALYGLDKRKAVRHQWRISEATLLSVAALGGGGGALLGMILFRHKTRHPKFTVLVPLLLVIHAVLCCFLMMKL